VPVAPSAIVLRWTLPDQRCAQLSNTGREEIRQVRVGFNEVLKAIVWRGLRDVFRTIDWLSELKRPAAILRGIEGLLNPTAQNLTMG